MIYTVHLDDEYVNVKKILKEIHRQEQGVHFENTATNGTAPEGYMTVEWFRTEAKASVIRFCDKHGIL